MYIYLMFWSSSFGFSCSSLSSFKLLNVGLSTTSADTIVKFLHCFYIECLENENDRDQGKNSWQWWEKNIATFIYICYTINKS